MLEKLTHSPEERGGFRTVDDAVVAAQAHLHLVARDDGAVRVERGAAGDGADAARFLARLRELLERPLSLLIEGDTP